MVENRIYERKIDDIKQQRRVMEIQEERLREENKVKQLGQNVDVKV